MNIPKARKIPKKLVNHEVSRVDNYHWMRLTDDQKNSNTGNRVWPRTSLSNL